VTDVSEGGGNNAPTITSSATFNVAENSASVGAVIATDADLDNVTYSITGGADQAQFTINSSTGALIFNSAPDYENPTDGGANNVYDVAVTASDGNGGNDIQNIAVTVTNIDESAQATISSGGASSIKLTTSSGTSYIDEIIHGNQWGVTGQGIDITYSFYNSNSVYQTQPGALNSYDDYEPSQASAFSSGMEAIVEAALSDISSYTMLNFVEVADSASVLGDLRFGYTLNSSAGFGNDVLGWGTFPVSQNEIHYTASDAGDTWFSDALISNYENAVAGDLYYNTVYHEIGHSLGLSHPHNTGTGGTGITFGTGNGTVGVGEHDGNPYTLMSYTTYVGGSTSSPDQTHADGFMMDDIAALQYLYGSNNTTNDTDTTYGSSDLTPNSEFEFTIWDAAGTDKIDWSSGITSANIDLNSGSFSFFGSNVTSVSDVDISSMGAGEGVLGIGYGVVIENATGGSANDTLTGNSSVNILTGGSGSDSLTGGAGNDIFVFNSLDGSDTVTDWNTANDTLQFSATTFSASGVSGISAGSAIEANDFISGSNITNASSNTGQTFLFDTDSAVLYYDADGISGGAIQVADLGTNITIDQDDIVMIA
jgi:hypothetical protein